MPQAMLEEMILEEAHKIIVSRMRKPGGLIRDIAIVKQYLQMEYGFLENEQFGCMFLNCNYELINHKNMFRGTITQCATYPREIAREALKQNASFVILVHNHPSQSPAPSDEDVEMTVQIKQTLAVLDIVLFDHIIVAGLQTTSLRSIGYLV